MNYTNLLLVILIPILLYILYHLRILTGLLRTRNEIEAQELDLLLSEDDRKPDPLFNEVISITQEHDKITTELLQNIFDIGYARACQIIDQLEEIGIISAQVGNEPRKVIRKVRIN